MRSPSSQQTSPAGRWWNKEACVGETRKHVSTPWTHCFIRVNIQRFMLQTSVTHCMKRRKWLWMMETWHLKVNQNHASSLIWTLKLYAPQTAVDRWRSWHTQHFIFLDTSTCWKFTLVTALCIYLVSSVYLVLVISIVIVFCVLFLVCTCCCDPEMSPLWD